MSTAQFRRHGWDGMAWFGVVCLRVGSESWGGWGPKLGDTTVGSDGPNAPTTNNHGHQSLKLLGQAGGWGAPLSDVPPAALCGRRYEKWSICAGGTDQERHPPIHSPRKPSPPHSYPLPSQGPQKWGGFKTAGDPDTTRSSWSLPHSVHAFFEHSTAHTWSGVGTGG